MTSSNKKSISLDQILTIVVVIGVGIWLLRSCTKSEQARDIEMKGRGMLQMMGVSGDLPPNAGTDYYYMREDPAFRSEDYQRFFRKIKMYQAARRELSDRGLSKSEIDKIPERVLYKAMESSDSKTALDRLAAKYD